MIDIVDLVKIIPPEMAALMDERIAEPILQDIAEAARDKWIQLAGRTFKTTRQDYISGLQPVEYTPGQAVIALVGVLPLILEEGMEEQDLYQTLLGPNVPLVPLGERGKHPAADGGEYRAIPFRHATPGTAGVVGQPMGRVAARLRETEAGKRIKELARDVYKEAKKLVGSRTDPYGNTEWGGRFDTSKMDIPKLDPRHATNIYEGMVKKTKFYRSQVQSQYMTFRTIATGPDGAPRGGVIFRRGDRVIRRQPAKWHRGATDGAHLRDQVATYVARVAPGAIAQYVEGLK